MSAAAINSSPFTRAVTVRFVCGLSLIGLMGPQLIRKTQVLIVP
jgi:hypothetical protein